MLAVALALAAMLCVTAASVSPAHIHLNDPADRCDICVTAHLSVRNVAFVQIAQPVLVQSFLAPPPPVQRFESRGILVSLTRGPPSSL